jgi:hypothetical protein
VSDTAVNSDHLAMIAAEPAERAVKPWRIEAPDIDSRTTHPLPESERGRVDGAHPVIDHADNNSGTRPFHQSIGKHLPPFIFMDDVAFKIYSPLSRFYRFQPGRIIFGGVFEYAHGIAREQGSAGGSHLRSLGHQSRAR